MRFFLAITALVAAVTAAPSADVAAVNQMAAMTLAEADASCGNGASLYCCDKSKQGGDTGSPGQAGGVGLLGAIVGVNGLLQGLLGQCSKININAIGAAGVLNQECTARAACCQNTPSVAHHGLVNIALPCIPINSLVG
ncbi:Hydrophobin [Cordyceps militaris CM01]|uniref:Class I hydrophobin 3 n=2 Tax=Cordyceps militaris TaxID=73501 RepID=HYD3_CORMI|nr:Hydrophobin [Cordyceps militaris CM01]ATY63719.1 class I hydrophobin [Cordyceps militaris]EGX90442.1 Hydrophobin [Cordyceps militaris CM01]